MTIKEINEIPIYTKEDACTALKELDKFSIVPNAFRFGRYTTNYVKDENKSVKWNREFVEKENAKYDAEAKRLKELAISTRSSIINKYLSTLSDTLNEAQLNCIYNYAYNDKHSYGYWDVFVCCEELVDLIKIVEINK